MAIQTKHIYAFFLVFTLVISSFFYYNKSADAQDATPTPTPSTPSVSSVGDCASKNLSPNDCVQYYQSKLNDAQSQDKSLSSQIAVMDSQVQLTEARIFATKEDILSVEEDINTAQNKITNIESSLADLTKILMNRVVVGYEVGSQDQFQVLLTSNNISDFFKRANYLRVIERHDKQLIYDTVQAKNDYANQKQIFEDKKKKVVALQLQLEAYTEDLNTQKQSKQALLSETQGSESNYQQLLAQAKAQLAGFSRFVTSQGGASLLSGQTTCDDWGCYYNQRDSQWGSLAINGQGDYSLAGYGCLITSMAMIASHAGHRDILPSDIAVDPGNFSVGTAMLRFTINAKGVSLSRTGISRSNLDTALQSGPVIVGISYDGGPYPDHFLVLRSGSSGSYQMNDPYTANGHNIAFTSHYSLGSIVEIDKVSVN